jgi:hypothetical protein
MSKKEWHVERIHSAWVARSSYGVSATKKAGSSCGPSRKTLGARLATWPASTGAALSYTERTDP